MLQPSTSIGAISLRELLSGADFQGAHDIFVQSCASDSRDCRPGDLFVALTGTRRDGHVFVPEAISKGAQAVVAERALSIAVPTCIVADAREAYGQICQALAGHPSQFMKMIGVTGTNGKTTTAHLIASVLRTAGYQTGLLSTLGYSDSIDSAPAELTTPAAPTLARWLGRMAQRECSHAVIEVSSHAIAQSRIAGLEFAQVCLTNLGRDHLDFHGTLAHYHHAKTRLFSYLSPGGLSVINADDPLSVEHAPLLPNRVLTIGLHSSADLTASVVERLKSEQTFLLSAGNVTVPVRTAMIGDHHVYNCLTAAAVGLAQGMDLATIARGLEAVQHVPGRLERIECGQPFGAYVDFAHTPDALAVSLETLREVTVGRIICVFGAGGNRDTAKRPLMGRAVESRADVVIVTTDNPRFEDRQAIAADIFSGFERFGEARWIADRTDAIHYALSLAEPDDCVLVAGRGHESFQQVGHDRVALDDRDLVRRYLYNLEPGSSYGALMTVGNS
jgi:UDP-N-acetylmuramoyl-L-alanyl-D-glutamate--2,6-diaminopimelate ligase